MIFLNPTAISPISLSILIHIFYNFPFDIYGIFRDEHFFLGNWQQDLRNFIPFLSKLQRDLSKSGCHSGKFDSYLSKFSYILGKSRPDLSIFTSFLSKSGSILGKFTTRLKNQVSPFKTPDFLPIYRFSISCKINLLTNGGLAMPRVFFITCPTK